jgi:MoxR-like ATPase
MENNTQSDLPFENRLPLKELLNAVTKIKAELKKVIVGQDNFIEFLIIALLADGHVLIEGVPGVAKTITAKLLAKTISSDFSRIQFTPDLMPSDILGTSVLNMKTSEFEFKKGPIFSNLILIDEVNRAPAKTQAALFEVMEERQVTIDGNTYQMAPPFMTLATQNPIEQEGTYALPEAQLDRFLFKINVQYPSKEEEEAILKSQNIRKSARPETIVKTILSESDLLKHRHQIFDILIDEKLVSYIANLVTSTRSHPQLFLGGSPRASIAILQTSKVCAAINGRDFVTPEDIQKVIFPVLRHRIILTPENEMEGLTTDHVIKTIIESIEVPR